MPARRQVLASAVAVAVAGCQDSGAQPVRQWPQVHYDAANTGYAPDGELPGDPAISSIPLSDNPVTSAVASENRTILGLEDSHVARDGREGMGGWLARSRDGRRPTGTPAVGDHVYVTERAYRKSVESSLLRALEPDTGMEAWRVEVDDEFVLAPTLVDGTLYVRSERGIHAVDAGDGTVRWSRDAEPFEVQGFNVVRDVAPAVGRVTVYVPGPSGVTAYDAETGEQQWHAPVRKVHASPVFAGDVVLTSGIGTGVTAVDADDGSERWSWEASGTWTSPAVADGTVYATGHGLVALDLDSGDVAWRHEVSSDVFGSPVVVGNSVVVASISRTRAVRREGGLLDDPGDERWSVAAGSTSTPTPVDSGLVIPAGEEKLWTIE